MWQEIQNPSGLIKKKENNKKKKKVLNNSNKKIIVTLCKTPDDNLTDY